MIRNLHRRNPRIGVVDLWARLRERGYSRCVESLWRVMRREGMAEKEKPKKKGFFAKMFELDDEDEEEFDDSWEEEEPKREKPKKQRKKFLDFDDDEDGDDY